MNRLYFFVTIILTVVYSCNSPAQKNNYTFFASHYKKFELDSTTTYVSNSIQYIEMGQYKYLSYLNFRNSELYFYNFESGNFHHKLKFPDKCGDISAHLIVNSDSIFIINDHEMNLFLINSKGEIINEFPLSKPKYYKGRWPSPLSATRRPIIKVANKVYVSCVSNKLKFSNFQIDLKTGSVQPEFEYPNRNSKIKLENMHNLYMVNNQYILDTKRNRLIYSYGFDHNIYSRTIKSNKVTQKKAGSKYISLDNTEFYEWNDLAKEKLIYETNDNYGAIIYDKYRDLFYRIGFKGLDKKKYKETSNKQWSKLPIVLVMDKDFNIVYERLLERNTYDGNTFFITPAGLYILNYKKSKCEEEKYVVFTNFKFDKK